MLLIYNNIKEYLIKKHYFLAAVMLVCLALPAFTQDIRPTDDPYAKFQGIWYDVIYDDERIFFVFLLMIFLVAILTGVAIIK
jgi:hypothetical protein